MTAPRVLVPRPAGAGDALVARLRELGLDPDHQPFVELVPQRDDALHAALSDLSDGAFTWLVLTSPAALMALEPLTVPPSTRVAVVGPGTAESARQHGIEPTLVADGSGQALVEQLPAAGPGEAVLFPASSAAAPTVPDGLRALGYDVRQVVAYRPAPTTVAPHVVDALRTGAYEVVVLTSAMIARLLAAMTVHPCTRIVTIGTPTTDAAREAGLRVDLQAAAPTPEALAAAVVTALRD